MNLTTKKHSGSIAGMIIIFMVSFLVFCICAIDAGYTVTARYKAQKTTETIALYMASYINSPACNNKTIEDLKPIKERFEDIYSNYKLSRNYRFEITEIDLKLNKSNPIKIKVTTETSIPSLFLRYAGIGTIKIVQTSYAKAVSNPLKISDSDEKSFTYKADEIITDKKGSDILINYNKDYFVFAGLKANINNENEQICWTDIGLLSNDNNKKHYKIQNASENFDVWCISKQDTEYDFSNSPDKTLGLIQYIKIIKADSCNSPKLDTKADTDEIIPVVTALNSVKIINKRAFLNEDF